MELKANKKKQKGNNVCLLDHIANVKQQLTKINSNLEVGLNTLTKEVAKDTKASETINKLHDNISDLKAKDDKI